MSLPIANPLLPKNGPPIFYQGPDLRYGAMPSVLFFALSAKMSLFEDPFNQAVLRLSQQGIRVFSWDLPFHGEGIDPHEGIRQWAHEFVRHPDFIFEFLDICQSHIDFLMERGLINLHRLGVAGLSRGAFIATHLAARDSRLKSILGFAPLTQPQPLEELKHHHSASFDKISLTSVADRLIHSPLRFYVGNHDTRVGTEACFHFIHTLTEEAFAQGMRSPAVELIIYPSIGHKGHGTPPTIFHDGADWIKRQLLTEEFS
jgi:pimeloyl-ACP methyl ester carboxylesterase